MRIVLCYPAEQQDMDRIAVAWPEATVINAGQERIAEAIFDADVFCGHAKVPIDWEGVVAQGRLRWIQSSAAGMDHCLVPAVIRSEIHVTSASGVLADQVAEHTIALITAWCRSLPTFWEAQKQREFVRRPTRDLTHATVGIIGFGGVGRRVAEVVAPFKTRILAVDLFPVDRPSHVDRLLPPEALDDVLKESDVVILCLPLNDDTRGLINADRMGKMKRTALLANMARGAIVVTDDLVACLLEGRIGGAVMDVTDPEPLPPDHALWAAPHMLMTPHVGGQSAQRIPDVTRIFCENIRRWRAGLPLINYLADKRLGFPIRGGEHPLWIDVERTIP